MQGVGEEAGTSPEAGNTPPLKKIGWWESQIRYRHHPPHDMPGTPPSLLMLSRMFSQASSTTPCGKEFHRVIACLVPTFLLVISCGITVPGGKEFDRLIVPWPVVYMWNSLPQDAVTARTNTESGKRRGWHVVGEWGQHLAGCLKRSLDSSGARAKVPLWQAKVWWRQTHFPSLLKRSTLAPCCSS